MPILILFLLNSQQFHSVIMPTAGKGVDMYVNIEHICIRKVIGNN